MARDGRRWGPANDSARVSATLFIIFGMLHTPMPLTGKVQGLAYVKKEHVVRIGKKNLRLRKIKLSLVVEVDTRKTDTHS